MATTTIMDVDKDNVDENALTIDEILTKLLSCSEEEVPLEKAVHVYDPRELQSGWQSVTSNAKYVACPDKRDRGSPASVKSEQSSNCPSKQKQTRCSNKDKKNDVRKEYVSEKLNKYESLGVLSYGVPSWRMIVDPETHTYLKRCHPCHSNDVRTKTGERNHQIRFLDPGGALDQHLADFIKRQKANKASPSNPNDNIGKAMTCGQLRGHRNDVDMERQSTIQRSSLHPSEELGQLLHPVNVFRPGDVTTTSTSNSRNTARPVLQKRPKPVTHNSCTTLTKRELSPLLTSRKVVAAEKRCTSKTSKGFPPGQQLKQLNKSLTPLSFQIVNPAKQQQKLTWLPITGPTSCLPRHMSDNPDLGWPSPTGTPHNPLDQAIRHLKSHLPKGQQMSLSSHLGPSTPCKVLEIPVTSPGLN